MGTPKKLFRNCSEIRNNSVSSKCCYNVEKLPSVAQSNQHPAKPNLVKKKKKIWKTEKWKFKVKLKIDQIQHICV